MIALGSPLPPGRPAARPPPDSRAADDHVRVSSQFSRQYCGCAAQYAGNGTAAARAASRYWRCSANWAASSSGGRSTLAWWAVAGQSAWCPRRRRGNWRDCCTGCSMPRMCPGLQPPARLTTALPNTPPHSETAGRMPPAGMLTPGEGCSPQETPLPRPSQHRHRGFRCSSGRGNGRPARGGRLALVPPLVAAGSVSLSRA